MNLQRYFIRLSYKGTHFSGWQIQPNAITVQETLADTLKKINHGIAIKVTGCGRTDAGVHAKNFIAHFEMDIKWDQVTFIYKLNSMLPQSISVQSISPVAPDVHARFSATNRTYHYFIHKTKNPFLADTSWFMKKDLDLKNMNKACQLLINHKRFHCFSKTITGVSSFECDVKFAEWVETENGYQFTISANRFLRNMVRAIVGTMIEVGINKKNSTDFQHVLDKEDRSLAGTSAPANGLFLVRIEYENNKEIFS